MTVSTGGAYMQVKKIANETIAATKAIRQNEQTLLEKKKKMYHIMYQSIPSLTITPFPPPPPPPPLSKFHWIQDVYMENMPKKTKLYLHFLLLRIYLDSPVHMSASMERIQICPVML